MKGARAHLYPLLSWPVLRTDQHANHREVRLYRKYCSFSISLSIFLSLSLPPPLPLSVLLSEIWKSTISSNSEASLLYECEEIWIWKTFVPICLGDSSIGLGYKYDACSLFFEKSAPCCVTHSERVVGATSRVGCCKLVLSLIVIVIRAKRIEKF